MLTKSTIEDDLLSLTQASQVLKISLEGVRQAIQRGRLVAVKVGPFRLITRAEVLRYAKNRRPRGRPRKEEKA